jgi:tetratricopeptide (TPR) repeat protein
MQKSLSGAVAGAVDAKLSKTVMALPYTDSSKALDAFIQGMDLLARGKNADAFKSLQKATAADPAFRDLWYFLGRHYASREFNYEKAISYLSKTIARYPNDPAAHYWLGFAYYLQGATMPAIRAFETTIKLKPASYDSYVYLAMLNKDLGEYQKVETYYIKALEYTPGNAAVWYNLAGIQAQLNKPEDTVASLRRALSINCPVFLDIVRTDSDFAPVRKTGAFINTLREFAKKCK